MKYFLALFSLLATTAIAGAPDSISGAGSSAAFPVYRTWAAEYAHAKQGQVAYDAIGSSGGIKKIRAREVDFGGSDVAPPPAELNKDGLVALPTVISGVVPIYNLPGLKGTLILNGQALARIFLGDITRWDAREIRELNPHLKLPAQAILPVVRADGSGTTYNFTDYLTKVSPAWHDLRGVNTKFTWPENFAAMPQSAGVVEKVLKTPYAISYVDYNYVIEQKLSAAQMMNAEGRTISASPESFRAALRVSEWQTKGDFSHTLTNQSGKESWPITMGTFVLLPKIAVRPEQALRTIHFFTWAFIHGDELANRIYFVRLPDAVQGKAFRILASITDRDGRSIAYETLKSIGKIASK